MCQSNPNHPKLNILIHGFNVRDGGKSTIRQLTPFLSSWYVLDYGYFGLWQVRFHNKKIAKQLVSLSGDNTNIYAHSNGCAIVAKALELGLVCHNITFIHPALDMDDKRIEIQRYDHLKVFHSKRDITTWIARWLLFHPWGAMGTYGSSSLRTNVKNVEDGCRHSEGFVQNPQMYI